MFVAIEFGLESTRQGFDDRQQGLRIQGFIQVLVGAGEIARSHVLGLVAAGQHDDAEFRMDRSQSGGQAEPILAGQIEIDDEQVRERSPSLVLQILCAGQRRDMMTFPAQQFGGHLAQNGMILDQDNVQAGIHSSNMTSVSVGQYRNSPPSCPASRAARKRPRPLPVNSWARGAR